MEFIPLRAPKSTSDARCSILVKHDWGHGRMQENLCKQRASCIINGKAMCGHHAGAYLFNAYMKGLT